MKDLLQDGQKIIRLAQENNGRVRTKDVVSAGIRREVLRQLLESGSLVRESRGSYLLPGCRPDPFAVLQEACPRAVFSFESAVFLNYGGSLYGIFPPDPEQSKSLPESERKSQSISVTVQQGYNSSRLKNKCTSLNVHYVKPEILELGLCLLKTPQGNSVRAYNPERCICDLIKKKSAIASDLFSVCLKYYFQRPDKDLHRLQEYARYFSLEERIYEYMEVLM